MSSRSRPVATAPPVLPNLARAADRTGAQRLDCLVVGGGPAGLTAALYLARFQLATRVVDRGGGRASSIPRTRNYPGFPDGISGTDLLARLREQVTRHGVSISEGTAVRLRRTEDGFACDTEAGTVEAAAVILATGIVDVRPPIGDELHDDALAAGALRYCPICDGFEVMGRRIAILGRGAHAAREALFVRGFSDDVTLLSWDGDTGLDTARRADLWQSGVAVVDGAVGAARMSEGRLVLATACGDLTFDAVYPALGAEVGSSLALGLGARSNDEGYLEVDEHQRTNVPGLYAIGDVVVGLNQISRATGQAATAATAVRNDLFGDALFERSDKRRTPAAADRPPVG